MPFFAFSIPFLTKQTPEEEMLSAWVKATDNIQSGNFKTADSYLHTVLKILSEQHERGEITEREYQGRILTPFSLAFFIFLFLFCVLSEISVD